jgi:hypothetical protein
MRAIRNTHKLWVECNTGIAYMPGSKDVQGPTRWRQGQSMVVADWSNPAAPQYIRTFGLPGGNPAAVSQTVPTSTSLHGAISAHEHPNAAGALARARTADDIIGNRIYAAWGVGDDGTLQIIDRKMLLPTRLGGSWTGEGTAEADSPTDAQLLAPVTGLMTMSPDQGGHTSMPVFGMKPKSYQSFTGNDESQNLGPAFAHSFLTRDIVLLASEATADRCAETPHWSFIVDVTVENSKTAPPGTRVEPNPWQGPMVLSTMSVDPRRGEKYPRGNYCQRGARFGVHSSEENFSNPMYGTGGACPPIQ